MNDHDQDEMPTTNDQPSTKRTLMSQLLPWANRQSIALGSLVVSILALYVACSDANSAQLARDRAEANYVEFYGELNVNGIFSFQIDNRSTLPVTNIALWAANDELARVYVRTEDGTDTTKVLLPCQRLEGRWAQGHSEMPILFYSVRGQLWEREVAGQPVLASDEERERILVVHQDDAVLLSDFEIPQLPWPSGSPSPPHTFELPDSDPYWATISRLDGCD